jgi:hypothetical protein
MNVEKKHAERDEIRQLAAAEVIELGEMLFDTAIDAATQRSAEGEEVNASLVEELRTAADEFFTALWLLLEAGQSTPSSEVSALRFQVSAVQDKKTDVDAVE